MALRTVLTTEEDFRGFMPITERTSALWRFDETAPDANTQLKDASPHGRHLTIAKWNGTTASLVEGWQGRYIRINRNDPATEKTYLKAINDGKFFTNLGEKIAVGGWINPTTCSVAANYCPVLNTRQGPGQPIFYISLISGKPRMMLYSATGSLLLDQSETPPFALANSGWYYIGAIIEMNTKTSQFIVYNRQTHTAWTAPKRTFTGTLNSSCTADIVLGMHADQYYFAGGLDEWFLETDSALTLEDLARYARQADATNGNDLTAGIDTSTEPGSVLLKKTESGYADSGVLETISVPCALVGSGRVSVKSEYAPGITAISLIETATSPDQEAWSVWQAVGPSGELVSPNNAFIRYRITLTSSNRAMTPRLLEVQLHDIIETPKARLGFARPIVLSRDSVWEAVLENAHDIVLTGEVNGADTLEFKLPFNDLKRLSLDNEREIRVGDQTYRIRTLSDEKASDGSILTKVYAEADFYDLAYSEEKGAREFNADTADIPMRYALEGTDWELGEVNVRTLRTWQCEEKNALAILRTVQKLHGGDLVFDSKEKKVSLLTFGGKESGALFAFRKNLTSIQRMVDTRSLITRLYATGKEGITFASINDGKPYVEDFAYTDEVRVSSLDLSNFTNPYQMLEFTKMRMAEYAKPRVSYILSAMDLSVLTEYAHEEWALGDIVTVDDRDLNMTIRTRIVRRQYNPQEPWKTVLELSSKLRELGDSNNEALADKLDQSEAVLQEIKDMVPFNHLRNSRGDHLFAYWENAGFEVDAENGVSGTASFKAEGVPGMTKSISQTVYPASRRSYTISAQIGSENLQKGPEGQVGIEIEFEYEDGSVEKRFIDLY